MQLKHVSEPSVFKATNNAVEIILNNSGHFMYMQHISDHHLSIYLISSNHLLKHNISFIYPSLTFVEQYILVDIVKYSARKFHEQRLLNIYHFKQTIENTKIAPSVK